MKRLLILLVLLATSPVFAGWDQWTPQQKASLKAWTGSTNIFSTCKMVRVINRRPVTNTFQQVITRYRDKLTVMAEKKARSIAQDAGITKNDSEGEKGTKLKAMIATAPPAGKPEAIYKANLFWTCYWAVRSVEKTGQATTTRTNQVPMYGASTARLLGLPTVTGSDVEKAIRTKL